MKPSRNIKSRYPKPFQSGWMDDGSRTIDNGKHFEISVDEHGLEARMESGPWAVSDLFGEMGYWPEHMVWEGSAGTLSEVLLKLGKKAGLTRRELLAPIIEELDEHHELGVKAYLAEEKGAAKGNKNLSRLRQKWSVLHGCHQIPGIPSPEMWVSCWANCRGQKLSPKDCRYNGLELDFDQRGWTAKLYTNAHDFPELFHPLIWDADTFDGLFSAVDAYGLGIADYLPWTRDELATILIKEDTRWKEFIKNTP